MVLLLTCITLKTQNTRPPTMAEDSQQSLRSTAHYVLNKVIFLQYSVLCSKQSNVLKYTTLCSKHSNVLTVRHIISYTKSILIAKHNFKNHLNFQVIR